MDGLFNTQSLYAATFFNLHVTAVVRVSGKRVSDLALHCRCSTRSVFTAQWSLLDQRMLLKHSLYPYQIQFFTLHMVHVMGGLQFFRTTCSQLVDKYLIISKVVGSPSVMLENSKSWRGMEVVEREKLHRTVVTKLVHHQSLVIAEDLNTPKQIIFAISGSGKFSLVKQGPVFLAILQPLKKCYRIALSRVCHQGILTMFEVRESSKFTSNFDNNTSEPFSNFGEQHGRLVPLAVL